jgi:two-component system NtrC family sensor kinase
MTPVEGPEALGARRPWSAGAWLTHLSLRSRLIAAFVVLIVSSASATIAIGGVVFVRKLYELATQKMETGLRVAELSLASYLERMELLARVEARRGEGDLGRERFCRTLLAAEPILDVSLVISGTRAEGVACPRILTPGPALTPGVPAAGPGLPGERQGCQVVGLPVADLPAQLRAFLGHEPVRGRTRSGLIVLRAPDLRSLGLVDSPRRGLVFAAVAPFRDGRSLVLLTLANGRTELVSATVRALGPEGRRAYAASIFLPDVRITTTLLEGGLGTKVDREVVKKVLERGEFYVGSAVVVDSRYYTAYRPLRDFRGQPIGILGIGTRESVYADLRNKTIGLFAALIGLGMIFGFAMTYWFSRWLIRPVRDLAEGMDRVARGDLSYKVRIYSSDELGTLARAFNLMVKDIQERDIRLREMTAEKLSHVEKQISIGRVAAGVAHEINNPLTSVLSLSILVLRSLPEGDRRREDLEIVVEETTRCRDIVRNLLDFARERPTAMRVFDLHQVIRDTLVLTSKYEGMDRIRTRTELAAEPLHVLGDPKQIQQVLTNLITNAGEAIGEKGEIVLSTDDDSSGGFVVTRIRDNGKGIPKENLHRIFEPFFTTKGTGKGTGLGLSVTLGIVRKHSGSIDIESTEGQGTTVTILLPRANPDPAEA